MLKILSLCFTHELLVQQGNKNVRGSTGKVLASGARLQKGLSGVFAGQTSPAMSLRTPGSSLHGVNAMSSLAHKVNRELCYARKLV